MSSPEFSDASAGHCELAKFLQTLRQNPGDSWLSEENINS